ncbi:zinc-binding dehydrogenase [Streptomyces sp. NPDC056983]|uniref:zinc-binding dehydrogenase n=1 Tax=Streptomyces sp. NPDC056983 TaxID=3345987 RepID=UPI003630D9B4
MRNRQWIVAAHASGELTPELWSLAEGEVPSLGPRQLLVRARWLSVDPYMRGRLNQAGGVPVGDVMIGSGVGEVVASEHPDWAVGDLVECPQLGWQEYGVVTPDLPGAARAYRIDPEDPEPWAALSWLGMPGLTAYFAMTEVARPRPGDTVVVSAAAGAVGQIAGQIAAMAGARVIGVAGSDEKLAWCTKIGFHGTLNYRTSTDLLADVRGLAPAGVDVFFDGTGGPIHDAVLDNLAVAARVAVVGKVAVANEVGGADIGTRASARLIRTRASLTGFQVYDWWHRRDEAIARLKAWRAAGQLHFREDTTTGFESVPDAFLRMMRGENLGKQLVKL